MRPLIDEVVPAVGIGRRVPLVEVEIGSDLELRLSLLAGLRT